MGALTFKSQFRHRERETKRKEYQAPSAEHVCVNDALCDAELAAIAQAKLTQGVNGSCGERVTCSCPNALSTAAVPLVEGLQHATARSALPEAVTRRYFAATER